MRQQDYGLGDLSDLEDGEVIKSAEDIRAEWLQLRRGKFTASEFHRLMTCPSKQELPEGAKSYAIEKAVETLTEMDESDRYVSSAMQWGVDHEQAAIVAFTERTGHTVSATGENQRLILMADLIGCTPDGLIGDHAGIEVKCPNSKTHFGYCLMSTAAELKAVEPKYYWQIMGSLMITERQHWYFVSYDPRFYDAKKRLHIVKIARNDEDILALFERIDMAVAYRQRVLGG
ncbi:lambda exonuclease family protein [Crenothrix polyspora]|uniref:YqaJ recombinase family protein n=1 Tax=Crenothrix polyspora TaxID=360316 RepID=A0A1R4HFD8_9GAMM|nr:lambda exonuclease family protein [Crenothrix polyspora]SJM94968.1 YqaJ recombinase family protein [Crenothrix polyspora]